MGHIDKLTCRRVLVPTGKDVTITRHKRRGMDTPVQYVDQERRSRYYPYAGAKRGGAGGWR